MAPEQIRDAKHVGKPADVFGLGATLYTLLAGRAPFLGPTPYVIFANTVNSPLPKVSDWRPDVSSGTIAILETSLSKEAERRYPDCAAMLEDLKYWRNVLDATGKPDSVAPTEHTKHSVENGGTKFDNFGFPIDSPKNGSVNVAHTA
jgi:serine/threonine-protein kinase